MRVSRQLYFLNEKISHTQKVQKSTKKHKKAQNAKQATFFYLDVFYAHKNAAFVVFIRLDNFKLLCFFYEKILHAQNAQKRK